MGRQRVGGNEEQRIWDRQRTDGRAKGHEGVKGEGKDEGENTRKTRIKVWMSEGRRVRMR